MSNHLVIGSNSMTSQRFSKPMLAVAAFLALVGCSNGQDKGAESTNSDANNTAETTEKKADAK